MEHSDSQLALEEKVEKVLEDIRPSLALHEGDVRLFSVEDGVARLELKGACVGCSMSTVTLRMGLEKALCDQVPEIKKVVQVDEQGEDLPEEWEE